MLRALPARGRAAIGCVGAALAITAGGCATTAATSSVTVSGKTLTIYASAPIDTLNRAEAQDVIDAAQLALREAGSQVARFTLQLDVLNGDLPEGKQVTANARTAIENTSTIAYLGELDPGASAGSIPITNDQDILQISPLDTAIELTQATPAVPGAPASYYAEASKSYGYTFARVVPSATLEAEAQVSEMGKLAISKLYVASDGSDYGAAIALAVAQKAKAAGISVVQGSPDAAQVSAAGADGAFLGASTPKPADAFFDAVAAADPTVKLFGSSPLDNPTFADALNTAAQPRTYVSAPGFLPADLNSLGTKFVTDFEAAYHHVPALGAIFGYEAMSALVSVIQQAGTGASNRATIVHDFMAIKNRQSVLGTYSITDGNPTIGPFVFSRFKGGQLTPFAFVSVQG